MTQPPATVLVVDDDPAARNFLVAVLKGTGIESRSASSGEEGLRLLDGWRPALIIADVNMPGMNGYDFCRAVRDRGLDDVPFFFCSGLGTLPERVAGLRLGADDYLVKPVDPTELALRVQQQLQRSRSLRHLQGAAESESVLSGTLSEIGLAELLQVLDTSGGGDAVVRIAEADAEVCVSAHEIVHARVGALTGRKALFRLLEGANQGRFQVVRGRHDGPPTVGKRIDYVVLEGLSQIDEARMLRARIEDRGEVLELAPGAEVQATRLSDGSVEVLRLVEKHGTLRAILDASSAPDLDVVRTIVALVEAGFITARPRAAEAPAPEPARGPGSWAEALRELTREYLATAPERISAIEEALRRLRAAPEDTEALQSLLRSFHGLAGTGSTYGFPRLTEIGLEGERECARVLRERRPVRAEELEAWESRADVVRDEFTRPPRVDAAAMAAPPPAPRPVLIACPEPMLRRALAPVLEEEGLSVLGAETAEEALRVLDAAEPRAVVLDVDIPGSSAYDLVRTIRSRRDGEDVVVVVISRGQALLDKVDAIHSGADAYFQKPIDFAVLSRRLHHLLEVRGSEPARVMVVEDDPIQAFFVRSTLERAGYSVHVLDEPSRFEAELAAFAPDVLVVDVLLPGVLGYDLVRIVRHDERYATLPIIFMTIQGQVKARVEAQRSGGDDLLVKPVTPWLLLATVSARIERSRFLKRLIDRDGLTQLLNHGALVDRARATLAMARRDPKRRFVWAMIDIDHFKPINDTHGHGTGDRVLAGLAALLRRRLRQTDVLGRYGGDEFVAILEDLSAEEAVGLISRLRGEFAGQEYRAPDGSSFHASFSAGVASLEADVMSVEAWKEAADQALYAVKNEGGGGVQAAPAKDRPRGRRRSP